ncbi:MAG: AccI family restriction endonuclease [Planctomycetaceae bacterium]|jgi:type II restriction enzyme|nr:AccI family restriction endonuclease [Planctomycetaceae bacterium]
MQYKEQIRKLIQKIPVSLIDFSLPRDMVQIPTQASSNFITNREQGDGAENLITQAINKTLQNYTVSCYELVVF